MKLLLLTDLPPCANDPFGRQLSEMCALLPVGSMACFTAMDGALEPRWDPRLDWMPRRTTFKPGEWGLVSEKNYLLSRCKGMIREYGRRALRVPKLIDTAVAYGRSQQVDAVWAVLRGQTSVHMAEAVTRRLQVPLFSYVVGPLDHWLIDHLVDPLNRKAVLAAYGRVIRRSASVAAATPAMATELSRTYNVEAHTLFGGLPHASARVADGPAASGRLAIGLASQVPHSTELMELLAALEASDWRIGGREVHLRVPDKLPTGYHTRLDRIRSIAGLTQAEIVNALAAESDVMYVASPFGSRDRRLSQLQLPGDLPMALATGRPVVLHGPVDSAAAQVMNEPGAVRVVEQDVAAVIKALRDLAEDSGTYSRAAAAGSAVYQRNFSGSRLQSDLARFFGVEDLAQLAYRRPPAQKISGPIHAASPQPQPLASPIADGHSLDSLETYVLNEKLAEAVEANTRLRVELEEERSRLAALRTDSSSETLLVPEVPDMKTVLSERNILEQLVSQLRVEHATLRAQLDEAESGREALRLLGMTEAEAQLHIYGLREHCQSLQSELADLRVHHRRLAEAASSLTHEVGLLQASNADLRQKMFDAQAAAAAEHGTLRARLDEAESGREALRLLGMTEAEAQLHIYGLREHSQSLQSELADLRVHHRRLAEAASSLTHEVGLLQASNADLRQTMLDAQAAAASEILTLQSAHERMAQEDDVRRRALLADLEQSSFHIYVLNEKIQQQAIELERAKALQANPDEKEGQALVQALKFDAANVAAYCLMEDVQRLTTECATRGRENAVLVEKLAAAEAAEARMDTKVRALADEAIAFDGTVLALSERVEALESANRTLSQDLEGLRYQYAAEISALNLDADQKLAAATEAAGLSANQLSAAMADSQALRERVLELDLTVESLTQRAKLLEIEKGQLLQEFEDKQREQRSAAQSALAIAQQESAAAALAMELKERELSVARAEAEALRERVLELDLTVESLTQRAKLLETEKGQLLQEFEDKQREQRSAAQSALAIAQQESAAAALAMELKERELSVARAEAEALRERVLKLDLTVESLTQRAKLLETAEGGLRQDMLDLIQEKEAAEQMFVRASETSNARIEALTAEVEKLASERTQLTAAKHELELALKSLEQQLVATVEDAARNEAELSLARAREGVLLSRVADLDGAVGRLSERVEMQEAEKHDLRSEVLEARSHAEQQRAEAFAAQGEIVRLQAELDQTYRAVEQANAGLDAAVRTHKAELATTQAEVRGLGENVRELEGQLLSARSELKDALAGAERAAFAATLEKSEIVARFRSEELESARSLATTLAASAGLERELLAARQELDRAHEERQLLQTELMEARSALVDRSETVVEPLQGQLAHIEQAQHELHELMQSLKHTPELDGAESRTSGRLSLIHTEIATIRRSLTRSAIDEHANEHYRVLYLDLLEGALTGTLNSDPNSDPWSPKDFDSDRRLLGRDWPKSALTMIGTVRMRNVRTAVQRVLEEEIPGDLIEAGVWRGGACIYMRGILEAYGDRDRTVWVADSFAGLPPPEPSRYPNQDIGDLHHTYPELIVSAAEVRQNFAKYNLLDDRVKFLEGWFKDTLPSAPIKSLSILRLDGDMYSSTMDTLDAMYPRLSEGGFVIIDDYVLAGCKKAVIDYRRKHGIATPIEEIDGAGVFWRKREPLWSGTEIVVPSSTMPAKRVSAKRKPARRQSKPTRHKGRIRNAAE